MKLQLIIITLFFTLLNLYSFSQDIDYKKFKKEKHIVTVNEIDYARILDEECNMSIYDLNGENELIYIKYMSFSNSYYDSYYIVRFLDFEKEAEIRSISIKEIIRKLYNSKVINGNIIDEDKMKRFVYKYGKDESKNRLVLNNE